jgi:hypothetical protein
MGVGETGQETPDAPTHVIYRLLSPIHPLCIYHKMQSQIPVPQGMM